MSAVAELAEALTELGAQSVADVPAAAPEPKEAPESVPAARSVVPQHREGMKLSALAPKATSCPWPAVSWYVTTPSIRAVTRS